MRPPAALLAAVLIGCGTAASGPPGQPANAGLAADDSIPRFDAEVERALAELDRVKRAIPRGPALDPATRVAVPLTAEPGEPVTWVSVTYFYELACKYCFEARPVVHELDTIYNADRVVFIPRVIIVHRAPAMAAHLAACAARRRGHDVLSALWAGAYEARDYTSANLLRIVAEAGVPAADVVAELATGACIAEIMRDHGLAMGAGVKGTPTFFVNGRPIEGLPDRKLLADAIGSELQRVEAYLSRGGDVAGYHADWQQQARKP